MNNRHVFNDITWSHMTMFEQMGNIGSEVGRALSAKRSNKLERMTGAFYRGLDLIDETALLWSKQKSPRLRELLIARELFSESILGDVVDISLEKYFMEFAMAARLRSGV